MVKKFFLIFFLFFFFFFSQRTSVISLFKVESKLPQHVNLIVIMGGGTVGKKRIRFGKASMERLKKGITLLKEGFGDKVFFAGFKGEQNLANRYMMESGVKKKRIIFYFNRSKTYSGTVGDIKMVVDVIKDNGFKSVAVVTSPYHEKRCEEIFSKLLKKGNLNVKIYFPHIKGNGEIEKCNFLRYFKLIFHEFFALMYEKVVR